MTYKPPTVMPLAIRRSTIRDLARKLHRVDRWLGQVPDTEITKASELQVYEQLALLVTNIRDERALADAMTMAAMKIERRFGVTNGLHIAQDVFSIMAEELSKER